MLQSLVRNWLLGQARARMQEAATQAASGAFEQAQTSSEAPPVKKPEVCHVGLVFALGIEAGGLVDRLSGAIRIEGDRFTAREGGLGGKRLIVVESGAGQKPAASATEKLILGHHPQWIISAGFAGGLDERLKQGDFLLANSIADTTGQVLDIDLKMADDPAQRLHVGRLLTVDRVIRDPEEKRRLGGEHRALAVDMETLAVAQVCRREQVRFLSVRVIIDAVDKRLPHDIDVLVNKQTTAGRVGAAAGAIFRRPSSIKDMWQLKEDALAASERLAKFVSGVVAQLG